jgi:hypothetical protein
VCPIEAIVFVFDSFWSQRPGHAVKLTSFSPSSLTVLEMRLAENPVNWVEVDSSNVNRVAYCEDNKRLAVQFNGGSFYVYSDVDYDVFKELVGAVSVGSYMNRVVKALHTCERVHSEAGIHEMFQLES